MSALFHESESYTDATIWKCSRRFSSHAIHRFHQNFFHCATRIYGNKVAKSVPIPSGSRYHLSLASSPSFLIKLGDETLQTLSASSFPSSKSYGGSRISGQNKGTWVFGRFSRNVVAGVLKCNEKNLMGDAETWLKYGGTEFRIFFETRLVANCKTQNRLL